MREIHDETSFRKAGSDLNRDIKCYLALLVALVLGSIFIIPNIFLYTIIENVMHLMVLVLGWMFFYLYDMAFQDDLNDYYEWEEVYGTAESVDEE